MSDQPTLPGTPESTCSPGSADGNLDCASQDGPKTSRSGQEAAHASHSRRQASAGEQMTFGTCGLSCSGSSASAILTESLASRLRALLGSVGSTEYAQTWRELVTPLGRVYWGHTASGRRTSGRDCGGWPTPDAQAFEAKDLDRLQERREECKERTGNGNGFGLTLGQAAPMLAGWCTPNAMDGGQTSRGGDRIGEPLLAGEAKTAGWATPQARDHFPPHSEEYVAEKKAQGHGMRNLSDEAALVETPRGCATPMAGDVDGGGTNKATDRLHCQVRATIGAPPASPAATGPQGVLNPAFTLWLMGFPEEWANCAPGAKAWETIQQHCSETHNATAKQHCAAQATP